jgi:hypothetical protein
MRRDGSAHSSAERGAGLELIQSRPSRVDSFRAARTESGVALEVGFEAGALDGREVRITDRIELTRTAAAHLLVALEQAVARSGGGGARTGREAPSHSREAEASGTRTPDRRAAASSEPPAGRLMRLIGELDVPHQCERSFRLAQGELLANRFLLTMNLADIRGDALHRVLQIGRELAMPADLEAQAAQRFSEAICVHFGFEETPVGDVCKIYLERAIPEEERRVAARDGRPVLVHTGFKWNVSRRSQVVTRYLWYPGKSLPAVRDRIIEIHGGRRADSAVGLALDVLGLAAARTSFEQVPYIEAVEDGNARLSFDLNLYATDLQLQDAQPVLHAMRDHFGVSPSRFQAVYDTARRHTFGHLAGGLHRDGSEFLSVYYGVQGSLRFASGLGRR